MGVRVSVDLHTPLRCDPEKVWQNVAHVLLLLLLFACPQLEAQVGGANPAACPVAHNLGNCRGTGKMHPFVPAAHSWLSGHMHLGLIWGSVLHRGIFFHTSFTQN